MGEGRNKLGIYIDTSLLSVLDLVFGRIGIPGEVPVLGNVLYRWLLKEGELGGYAGEVLRWVEIQRSRLAYVLARVVGILLVFGDGMRGVLTDCKHDVYHWLLDKWWDPSHFRRSWNCNANDGRYLYIYIL